MSQKFLDRVLEECFDRAHDPERGGLRLPALTAVLLENLEEAGVVGDTTISYYCLERGNVAAEVHAYACDAEDDVLQLFFCIDATADIALGHPADVCSTGKDQLDRAFRRMEAFVKRVQADRADDIDESQPVHELVQLIKESEGNQLNIELHVLTTGKVSERAAAPGSKADLRREVWDLTRLERVCGSLGDGAISIDFLSDFGIRLPCLVTPKSADGLQVLLTCIPGAVLADIYNTHRGALLERNVRSFLQFSGKVNKGIRATVLHAPHRFLPYNNGLSATAGDVEVDTLPEGLGQIKAVRDFQIVNGGQTSATIASCLRRDKADLRSVSVPMKLTVVPRNLLDGLVPQISRYANTQNRIQDSDFSANDPWHIEIERLSRATWTKATAEAPRGTRWFYERSRGQYADELAAKGTPAGRKLFRAENPSAQKFTKTDLAKFVLSWDQFPANVSRGAQKCFLFFTARLAQAQRRTPDEADFKRLVALGILFRTIERLHDEMEYQGFRANVVTYAMARLSNECQRHLDPESIWKAQALPPNLIKALKLIIPGVRDVVTKPPANQRNITEWSKKEDCWAAVLSHPIKTSLARQEPGAGNGSGQVSFEAALSDEQQRLVEEATLVAADVWFSVSKWAKTTSSLQSWQRSLAYSLGTTAARAKPPSIKQAVQGRNLLLEAVRLGFRHEALADAQCQRLMQLADVEK